MAYRGMSRPAFALTALAFAFVLIGMLAPRASAHSPVYTRNYSFKDFMSWFEKYKDATPDFKAGDVITVKDLENLRPFIPPGYFDQFNFPELKMRIGKTVDHTPRKEYLDCSEKYQNQVRLKSDGTLANYVCGQPFPNSALQVEDPKAGLKIA